MWVNLQKAMKKKTTVRGPFAYGVSTFRPLRRRARSTLRPLFVLILLRKPCTFFRFLTFG